MQYRDPKQAFVDFELSFIQGLNSYSKRAKIQRECQARPKDL